MTGKGKRLIKILSMCLILLLTVQCLGINASFAQEAENYNRTTDPSTMSDWENYTELNSTAYAGAIWLDKSVFKDTSSDDVKNIKTSDGTELSMIDDERNFLVSLSAVSATKSIDGYSLKPTDTVFVLDVSSSMYSAENASRIKQLVPAANKAIDALLKLNKNNRVAVVLYSGLAAVDSDPSLTDNWSEYRKYGRGIAKEDTTMVLLPLGRYTPDSNNNYIELIDNSNSDHENHRYIVQTSANLKEEGSSTTFKQAKKYVNGGTYIQNGLFQAWDKIFSKADTTVNINSVFQSGVDRLPVMILMSDGAPTAVTTNYAPSGNSIGDSNGGNCTLAHNTDDLAFLTQLTASWVSSKINEHYNEDLLFYTIGIGIDDIQSSIDSLTVNGSKGEENLKADIKRTKKTVWQARHVLNPMYSAGNSEYEQEVKQRIDSLWNSYNELSNSQTMDVYLTKAQFDRDFYTTKISKVGNLNRDYVTKFYDVNDTDDLLSTFNNIVAEIELQSKYLPTHVDSNENLDGYVTFIDDIGMYMDVKNVAGISVDNTLYAGADTTTVYNAAIKAIMERMNLSESEAKSLFDKAEATGQVYYNSESDFGNAIGWYAREDGSYIEFWDWDASMQTPPEGAYYTIKSYFFNEKLQAEKQTDEKDLMYISVQVRTEISTGKVSLIWRVPASLIPVSDYNVSIKGDINLIESEDDISASVEIERAEPISLLYEVGLRDDITSENVKEIMELAPEEYKITPDENGRYVFYSNMYDTSVVSDTILTQTDQVNTIAYFEPNKRNERFYFTENSDIFVKEGENKYVKYSGEEAPSPDGEYYYLSYIFEWAEHDTNNASLKKVYNRLYSYEIETAQRDTSDNIWYIPIGTVGEPTFSFDTAKTDNTTQTYTEAHKTGIEISSGSNALDGVDKGDKVIYAILGNNGKLSLKPSQGIVLSKRLTEISEPDENSEFTFTIKRTDEKTPDYFECTALLEEYSTGEKIKSETVTFTNGLLTYNLKANQQVRLLGLPADSTYELSEVPTDGYMQDIIYLDGEILTGKLKADVKVEENTQTYVDFYNKSITAGSLVIEKTLRLPSTMTENDVPSNLKFDFSIDFGSAYANKQIADSNKNVYTLDENGKTTIKLAAGEKITFNSIIAGTSVKVTEVIPDGANYFITDNVNDKQVTISEDSESKITFENTMIDTDGNFTVSKTVTVPANYDKKDSVDNLQFKFSVDFGSGYKNTTVYDSLGRSYVLDKDGKVDITLKKDESITFVNIKVDTRVTVKEIMPDDGSYKETNNQSTQTATITADNSAKAEFDNTLIDIDGDVTIKKTVTVPNNYDKLDTVNTRKFDFTVDFGSAYKNATVKDTQGKPYTLDDKGMVKISLKKDETITFVDIKVGTIVKVTEEVPSGADFKVTVGNETKQATVTNDDKAIITFDNTLIDIDGDVTIKKVVNIPQTLESTAADNMEFEFKVDFGSEYKGKTIYDNKNKPYAIGNDGILVVKLKKDQSITFVNIKVDTVVKVTEVIPDDANFEVDGNKTKQATIKNDNSAYIEFTNNLIDPDGDIIIKKTVTVPDSYDKKDTVKDLKFTFSVDFGTDYKNKTVYDSENQSYELNDKGIVNITLKQNEQIKFVNINVGTKVTVKETVPQDAGYEPDKATQSATIKAESPETIVFNNTMVDIDGDVTIKKTVTVPENYDKPDTVAGRVYYFDVDFGSEYASKKIYDNFNKSYDLDEDGIVRVSLKKDESITFVDIKVDTKVKATEIIPDDADYEVTDGKTTKSVKVTNDDKATIAFDNTLIDMDGNITIRKTVTIPSTLDKNYADNRKFSFTVDFGEEYIGKIVSDSLGCEYPVDENGCIEILLGKDDEITFVDIKVGTRVSVKEMIPQNADYKVTGGKEIKTIVIVNDNSAAIGFDNTMIDPSVPVTGDNTKIGLYVMLFSIGLGVMAVVIRKRKGMA